MLHAAALSAACEPVRFDETVEQCQGFRAVKTSCGTYVAVGDGTDCCQLQDHRGELGARHAEHYVEVARSAGLMDDAEGPMRHDLIVTERDNVRAVLDWARDTAEVEIWLRLATALENYWVTNAPLEGKQWLRAS